jgi:hypothetical protein
MNRDRVIVPYGSGLKATLEPAEPLRLSTMAWDFPERPDLIALAERQQRLDFLRDHLKSLCSLWDKLPRLFLDAYFRDIVECIGRNHSAIETPAAAHGGLFEPEDWCYAALCPLPQARLPVSPGTPVDFAFWTGAELHAVCILGSGSPGRAQREGRARLHDGGILITEIQGLGLQRAQARDLIARLPGLLGSFWQGVPLPSSPFRIGALGEIVPA